jgi:uncharacterized membrane protein
MTSEWVRIWTPAAAAFLASLVEFIEALTVVLAVGATRGWRGAVAGSLAALGVLLILVAALGPALAMVPLAAVQVAVGALLLLFGMRWLRKAILRSAGVLALHDEERVYAEQTAALKQLDDSPRRWDRVAIAAAFKITLLEGLEVVFIVIAVAAGGDGLLIPASGGAAAALVVVALLGVIVHRPIASIPENILKFGVGVLLSGFGTFWIGEGIGLAWPARDWSIPALVIAFAAVAVICVALCRARAAALTAGIVDGRSR